MKVKFNKHEQSELMNFVLLGPHEIPQSMATKDMLWRHIREQQKQCIAIRKFMLAHFATGLINSLPDDIDTTLLNLEMEEALAKLIFVPF